MYNTGFDWTGWEHIGIYTLDGIREKGGSADSGRTGTYTKKLRMSPYLMHRMNGPVHGPIRVLCPYWRASTRPPAWVSLIMEKESQFKSERW